MRSIIKLYIFAILTISAHVSWAQDLFLTAEPQSVLAGKAVLHGYRFAGKAGRANSGRPLLLTHGLNSNLHEFETLIPALTEAGYDCYAFNFRGHGNGTERSEITDYQEGDYDFEHMVQEDFPALIRHIQKNTRKKISVVGHSMGGMVPRAALISGTVPTSSIKSMVLLGSPAHFETKGFAIDGFGLDRLVELYAHSGSGKDSFDLFSMTSLLDRVGSKIPGYGILKFWMDPLTSGVGISRNFGEEDGWYHRAMSAQTPKDIYRSFLNFRKNGYSYRDEPVGVPVLHIVGLEDKLVPYQDVRATAPIQSADAGFWLIALEGISHLDLVASKALGSYRERMLDFLDMPARGVAKTKGLSLKIDPRSGSCEDWLK